VDAGATDCIWQVPVLKIEGLDYATYQVEILVGYMETLDHQADGSYSFWLDAIRIYDSAELDTKIDEDTTIGEVYGDDNEYAPQHMTLRDLLLAPADDNADITAKEQTGIVFIDGKDKATLAEYANPGPNNETYLSYQQSVAFRLKTNNKPASVQIGIKLAYGETAAQVKLGTGDFVKVVTATDMYYDLGSSLNWTPYDADGNEIPVNSMTDDTVVAYYMTAPIVLLNDTDGTVVSITNVKFTFPFPKPTPAMDEELSNVSFEDGAMVLSIGLADANGTNLASAEETAPAVTAVVDAETVEYALAVMNALYAPVVEPDPFVPEKLELNWSESTIKENKKATLTISTSTDVVSLTLNGEEMDYIDLPIISLKGWRISITYERVWFFTAKGLAVGTHNFAVVAYDEEGLASEPVETELTVTAKNNRKSNRR